MKEVVEAIKKIEKLEKIKNRGYLELVLQNLFAAGQRDGMQLIIKIRK